MANNFLHRLLNPNMPTERIKPMREMGVPGFVITGGRVQTVERNPKLVGREKYITASNILANVSIVAAGTHYFLNLVSSPNWSVEPVDDTPEAQRYAEFVESCMYDMDASWKRTIRRAGMYRFYGFGIQEWTAKKRPDGYTGFRSIETRPQHTIEQWDLSDEFTVRGMWQWSPMVGGMGVYIPRAKTIYLVDDTLSDSPEGFGLVRHLAEPADRYTKYLEIEGRGFERDFRGIPVGRAPTSEIAAAVSSDAITAAEGAKLIQGMTDIVSSQARGAATGIVLDSSAYENVSETGTSSSATPKWDIDLLTGSSNGIEHVGVAIDRITYDMALILGVEGLLTGKDGGSRALSEDKSRNMYLMVNSCVADIAETYEKDFINPLWTLNGFPEEYKPSLKAEDVSFKSVSEITAALRDMATAGAILAPNDPVIDDVRDILGVQRQPEELVNTEGLDI